MSIIPVSGSLRWEDDEFEASRGYTVTSGPFSYGKLFELNPKTPNADQWYSCFSLSGLLRARFRGKHTEPRSRLLSCVGLTSVI
jgi:hypothetical protein